MGGVWARRLVQRSGVGRARGGLGPRLEGSSIRRENGAVPGSGESSCSGQGLVYQDSYAGLWQAEWEGLQMVPKQKDGHRIWATNRSSRVEAESGISGCLLGIGLNFQEKGWEA